MSRPAHKTRRQSNCPYENKKKLEIEKKLTDPAALHHLHELERDVERDGYERVEKDEEPDELREVIRRARAVHVGPHAARLKVPVTNRTRLFVEIPPAVKRRAQERNTELKRADAQHQRVHLTLKGGNLARGPDAVAHELRVAAGEDHDADDPVHKKWYRQFNCPYEEK